MNKLTLALLFTVILFSACQKKDCACLPPFPEWPNGTEVLDRSFRYYDDVSWTGSTTSDSAVNDTIILYSKWHYYDLTLKFRLPKDTIGSYYNPANFSATLVKHTPLGAKPDQLFTLDNSWHNVLQVIRFKNSGQVDGNFGFVMKLSNPTGNIATDTVRAKFPSGRFAIIHK